MAKLLANQWCEYVGGLKDWEVQLELEGLLFFFDFSLANLVASGWPIVTLLYRLGDGFRQSFGNLVPNECDLLDGDRCLGCFLVGRWALGHSDW